MFVLVGVYGLIALLCSLCFFCLYLCSAGFVFVVMLRNSVALFFLLFLDMIVSALFVAVVFSVC